MTSNHKHKVAILERCSRLSRQFQISQITNCILDSGFLPISQATVAEIMPWKSRPMGQSVFDSGVGCSIVIFENKIIPDENSDGSRPLDVGVRGGVIDQERDGCSGEGFGCAPAVEER
jgi:hypothetical protein